MALTRLTIVDDHPLFRGALNQALSASLDEAEITEASSLDELNALLAEKKDIDLILLDLAMPGVQGLSGLLYLRAQHPEIPVVIVSAREDAGTIRRCIEFGASGFVPKSQPIEDIRTAVKSVLDGEVWTPADIDLSQAADDETTDLLGRLSTLTPQQVRVLMMLSEGLLNKQIAYKLSVSEATIKAHVSAILQKLGVDSRTQAVIAINKIEAGEWQKVTE
ncbi:MAG: response regulator transcription factor [Pseudomonadota bacterium]